MGAILLLAFAAGLYLLSINEIWWAGWSFGARRFTEAFPLFAVGLCAVVEFVRARPAVLGVAALAGLVAWNVGLSEQVRRGEIPEGDVVSFMRAAQGGVAQLYEGLGHPPSFPAPLLFAWKYGVTPDRFDELYGRFPRKEWRVRMGTPEDGAIVGRGWSRRQAPADGPSFRWSEGERSSFLLTLVGPADYRLRLEGQASRHSAGLAQTIGIAINGKPAGERTIRETPALLELDVPAAAWREGLNEVTLRYAWYLSRQDAYGGEDAALSAWRVREVDLVLVTP